MSKGGSVSTVTGFRYSLAMLMGLCRGPLDEIVQINIGDIEAWTGNVTTNGSFTIDQENLFGGDTKEGGVKGPVDVQMGAPDQDLTGSNFQTIVGAAIGGTLSSLRGVATLFFNGLICSNNPYPKKWSVRVRRAKMGWHGGTAWYPDEAQVALTADSGEPIVAMNPSHIVYECMTNPVWGRGLPRSALDEPSFISAANTLCRESFGLCMAWTRAINLSDFVQNVINHVGGAIYTDRTTGLLTFRLLRKDYVVSDLPLFTYETGLLGIDDDQTTAPDNSHSEIIVNYVDPILGAQRQTRVQNLAGTQANQTVTSTKVDYLGLPTAALAARVAQRDLMLQGAGIKRYKLRLDRRGRRITPAGVFRINVPDRNIFNMVLRAGNVEEGPIGSQSITVTAVQDVFSLEATTYLATPEHAWTPPDRSANPVEVRRVDEINYRDLVRVMTPADLATVAADTGDPVTVASQPTGLSTVYELDTHGTGEAYTPHGMFGWTPNALLANSIGHYDTSITVTARKKFTALGTLPITAWIDDEIVEVTSYDVGSGVMTIGRGCIDTVPAPHAANTLIWFPDNAQGADGRDYTLGEVVDVKLLTRTNTASLALADAPEDTWTVTARQGRPYVPGDFKIAGTPFASTAFALSDILFTWAHRDRITQSDHVLVHQDASTGPEAGVTYTVRMYTDLGVLLRTTIGITDDNWTYTTTMASADGAGTRVIVELEAVRDSIVSHQKYHWLFNRVRVGWGHDYGNLYGG